MPNLISLAYNNLITNNIFIQNNSIMSQKFFVDLASLVEDITKAVLISAYAIKKVAEKRNN